MLLVAQGIIPTAILIMLVMGSVLSGIFTVTESAAVGVLGALVLALLRRRLDFSGLQESLTRASMTIGMVALLFIGATAFAYVFRVLGGDEAILALINIGALDAWGVLLLVIGLIFLMGFFFDVLEILLIALPIFGPIVAPLDFGDHIAQADVVYWFAILVALTLQTSFSDAAHGLVAVLHKGCGARGHQHAPDLCRDYTVRAVADGMRGAGHVAAQFGGQPAEVAVRLKAVLNDPSS